MLQHEVPLIRDMGISKETAAIALGLTAGVGAVGKIGSGLLSEKIPVRYATMLGFGLQALGVLILLNAHSMAMVWAFVIVFGIGMGANITLLPLVISNAFSLPIFASIYGLVHFGQVSIGGLIGPPLAGHFHDLTNSYQNALTLFLTTYAVATIAIYFAWGHRPRVMAKERLETIPG